MLGTTPATERIHTIIPTLAVCLCEWLYIFVSTLVEGQERGQVCVCVCACICFLFCVSIFQSRRAEWDLPLSFFASGAGARRDVLMKSVFLIQPHSMRPQIYAAPLETRLGCFFKTYCLSATGTVNTPQHMELCWTRAERVLCCFLRFSWK